MPREMELTGNKISIQVGAAASPTSWRAKPWKWPTSTGMRRLRLTQNLPTQTYSPRTVQNVEILLWGANAFVIFYETSSSSYSNIRLGKIDDPGRLKNPLGTSEVKVTLTTDPN